MFYQSNISLSSPTNIFCYFWYLEIVTTILISLMTYFVNPMLVPIDFVLECNGI